jgi:hypothetical protein
MGAELSATAGGGLYDLTVYPAVLDSSLNVLELQRLRGGYSLDVDIRSSNSAIGDVLASPVTLAGGASYAGTQFQPSGLGTTVLSVAVPEGYNQPLRYTSVSVSVRAPGLAVQDNVAIGKNLQIASTVLLGQLASASGLSVTLSTDSRDLLFSASGTAAGSNSLTIDIPGGQSSASYFLQALADSGTATYTVSAPGYVSTTATVHFGPSGVVIAGPLGMGFPLALSASAKEQDVAVTTALLDPITGAFVAPQSLAGGRELVVSVTQSEPGVVSMASTLTIGGGSAGAIGQLTPLLAGSLTLSVPPPTGYATPQNFTSLTVFVTD